MRTSKEIDGTMFILRAKPRHMTPQIDRLGKMSHCSKGFNTCNYGVFQEADGKTFIFSSTS